MKNSFVAATLTLPTDRLSFKASATTLISKAAITSLVRTSSWVLASTALPDRTAPWLFLSTYQINPTPTSSSICAERRGSLASRPRWEEITSHLGLHERRRGELNR